MRFSDISIASLVAAPLAAAHGGIPGVPKVFGLAPNDMAKLKNRDVFAEAKRATAQGPTLVSRQGGDSNNRCGAQFGNAKCAEGYCCSSANYCGKGKDYCMAPDCQFAFGPGCDANKSPKGSTTRNIARPQLGNVAYGGAGIYSCRKAGTVAITYDDGPFSYTNGLLDLLKSYNAKATFFMTGINIGKGSIDDDSTPWPAVIKRMDAEGHQLASHTWSHQDLSKITKEQRVEQMVKLEMAMRNIVGKIPTYMRPPYSSCSRESGCEQDMKDLGYVVSYFDLDTDDYNQLAPEKIQVAKDNVKKALDQNKQHYLAIAHDIHEQTAKNLTTYMLQEISKKNLRMVTMGECMDDPKNNWYRDGSGAPNPPNPTPTGKTTSVDGTCGGTQGFTCIGFELGSCCSQHGWCGSSTDHCGTGCNSEFGTCNSGGGNNGGGNNPPNPAPTGSTSVDGTCGGANGYTCIGFALGSCCSQHGWCGSSSDHCGAGCNSKFGTCNNNNPTNPVSTDGTCGGSKKMTCRGSTFGNCCSEHGWCGSTSDHCGAKCQSAFGTCGTSRKFRS